MPAILIPDVAEGVLNQLRQRAATHGRTPEVEAKLMLEEMLQCPPASVWEQVNAFRTGLAASNRSFGDSTELLREDRDR
jgi:antitoxin FitA